MSRRENPWHAQLREQWRELTPARRRILAALAHGPRTEADLRANERARPISLDALEAEKLIARRNLRMGPLLNDELFPFYVPTPLGRAVLWAGQRANRRPNHPPPRRRPLGSHHEAAVA